MRKEIVENNINYNWFFSIIIKEEISDIDNMYSYKVWIHCNILKIISCLNYKFNLIDINQINKIQNLN